MKFPFYESSNRTTALSAAAIQLWGVYGIIVNECNEGIISIIFFKNDILPLLGLDLGYTVKYSPRELLQAEGYMCSPNTDTVNCVLAKCSNITHFSVLSTYWRLG